MQLKADSSSQQMTLSHIGCQMSQTQLKSSPTWLVDKNFIIQHHEKTKLPLAFQ